MVGKEFVQQAFECLNLLIGFAKLSASCDCVGFRFRFLVRPSDTQPLPESSACVDPFQPTGINPAIRRGVSAIANRWRLFRARHSDDFAFAATHNDLRRSHLKARFPVTIADGRKLIVATADIEGRSRTGI